MERTPQEKMFNTKAENDAAQRRAENDEQRPRTWADRLRKKIRGLAGRGGPV
jgi:hypothetical protein